MERDERGAVSVDRVGCVLQVLSGGEPLKQREPVLSLFIAAELESVPAVRIGEHRHEAVSQPMPSLGPCSDVIDQRQQVISVRAQRTGPFRHCPRGVDALVQRITETLADLVRDVSKQDRRRCSRDQVVMRRMEDDADRDAAVGDVLVAGEMEGIRRLIGRVRFTAFRGKPVP
jgi:hypothetical protein